MKKKVTLYDPDKTFEFEDLQLQISDFFIASERQIDMWISEKLIASHGEKVMTTKEALQCFGVAMIFNAFTLLQNARLEASIDEILQGIGKKGEA